MIKKIILCLVVAFSLALPVQSHAGLFGLFTTAEHNLLIEATELGNTSYVKTLIANGYPVNSVDSSGASALTKAAYMDNEEIAKILIDAGADINQVDRYGRTPLHWAARNNSTKTAKLLVKRGARTDIKDRYNLTAFEDAIKLGNVNVASVIDPGGLKAVETEAVFPVVVAAGAGAGGFSTTTVVAATGVAAAGAGVAVAAGGGGGGGGGSSSSGSGGSGGSGGNNGGGNTGGNNGGNNGGGGGTPPDPSVVEYNNQSGLAQINASVAYARGYTGSGIVVAVVDTGVDLNHSDLKTNILNNGKDFVNNDNSADSDCGAVLNSSNSGCWHGTHVAGIIAAVKNNSGMHGVAYNAKILPVRALDATGSGTSANLAAGIDYAVSNGAKVINLSIGGSDISGVDPFPDITSSIANAMNNNVLVFAAAGNDGDANPVWPARNATTLNNSISTGGVVAVASVGADNVISSFSNRCGDSKNWCLVAPGEDITSTVPTSLIGFNGYGVTSGTSMATPHASGAAAILLSEFPTLTPRQVTEILLTTATDLGATGVDDVYGYGLINLSKATQPIGPASIPLSNSVSGNSILLNNSNISMSSAFGDSLRNSGVSFQILDSYQRSYQVGLASVAQTQGSFAGMENLFESMGQNFADQKIQVAENISLGMSSVTTTKAVNPEDDDTTQTYLSLVTDLGDAKMALNYNIPADLSFNGDANFTGNLIPSNPFLNFINDGMSYVTNLKTGEKTSFQIGSFIGQEQATGGQVSGYASKLSYDSKNISLNLQTGFINEENTLLGSQTDGAFAISSNTPTWFSSIGSVVPITTNVGLFGNYNYGVSYPQATDGSLFQDVSQITTSSFDLGIFKNNNFTKNDKISFIVSQPLRVQSGSASLNVPVARDLDGNIYRSFSQLISRQMARK